MRINEEVSQAEHIAGILSGTNSTTSTAVVRAVAYRAPIHILAVVDAMAQQAKKSRTSMINMLLQVGIDEVREKLEDPELIEKLSILEAQAAQALMVQPGSTSESTSD